MTPVDLDVLLAQLTPGSGPTFDIVEVTPETCGAADDPVAQALHLLSQLDAGQLDEVLAYYRPPALRAVA